MKEIVMATNGRFVVTGDQALRISNASAELARQLYLQRDCKLDPEHVIATLQSITEGKLVPFAGGLRGRFIRTMPILIGGVSKDGLIEQLGAAHREVSSYAASMMNHKLFTTLAEPEPITLIDLCPADLGFTESPTTTDLFDVKRLAVWSETNLDGYVLDLCPAETGPHLAIQYKDQPKGEVLWIAMERIPDSDGYPDVFGVERSDGGGLWLEARLGGSGRSVVARPSRRLPSPQGIFGLGRLTLVLHLVPLDLISAQPKSRALDANFLAPRAYSFLIH